MRASWRIARILGIELRLHAAFLLVPAWAFLQGWREGGTAAAVGSALLVLAVFACVALHELGHSLVARSRGIAVHRITLLPFGGVAALSRLPERPRDELVIALAGPCVNLVLAGLLTLLRGGLPELGELAALPRDPAAFLAILLVANLVLAVFNLLPAFPMDGGRILRSLLAMWLPRASATHAAAALGQVLATGIGLLGLFVGNPFVVAMSVFLVIVSRREARWTEIRERLGGLRAGDLVRRDWPTLSPHDPVARCGALHLETRRDAFPVLDGLRYLGCVEPAAWRTAVRAGRTSDPVGPLARRSGIALHPAENVETWLPRLARGGPALVPVVESGHLLGFVATAELLAIAAQPVRPPPPLPGAACGWRLDVG